MSEGNQPPHIAAELARREAEARNSYRRLRRPTWIITEEQYVRHAMDRMNEVRPLTWDASDTQEAPTR